MEPIQLWLSSKIDLNLKAVRLLSNTGLEILKVPEGWKVEKQGVLTPFIITSSGARHYGIEAISAFCESLKKGG